MVESRNVPSPLDPHSEITTSSVGTLLEEFRPRLRRLIALRLDSRLARRIDAADVLQETFAEVIQRLDDFLATRPMPFFLWVRRLTAQRVVKLHEHHLGTARRDAGREVTPGYGPAASSASMADLWGESGPSPSKEVARGEIFDRVREALDQLELEDREVLALRYFERLSIEETALLLNLTPSGVSKRQVRALGRLRRVLPRAEDVPTPP